MFGDKLSYEGPYEDGSHVSVFAASWDAACRVLAQEQDTYDGRSQFVWIQFPNGDLALAVFPFGATYNSLQAVVEEDFGRAATQGLEHL